MANTTSQGALRSVILTKYTRNQIRKYQMGWTCSMYGAEKCVHGCGEET